jgi:hypothetical protein
MPRAAVEHVSALAVAAAAGVEEHRTVRLLIIRNPRFLITGLFQSAWHVGGSKHDTFTKSYIFRRNLVESSSCTERSPLPSLAACGPTLRLIFMRGRGRLPGL